MECQVKQLQTKIVTLEQHLKKSEQKTYVFMKNVPTQNCPRKSFNAHLKCLHDTYAPSRTASATA